MNERMTMMSKPVLFVSFRPLERAENLRAIYDAYPGPKVHKHTYDKDYKTEVTSGKYDLMVIDEFPNVTPGKCIMIWHGIQGGKTIGLDQPGTPYYEPYQADLMTYIISAGTGMVNVWSECTAVPRERILPLGMPRTDEYTAYKHEPNKQTTYLFVPTFRDLEDTPFPQIDWAYLNDHLTDNEVLVVKAHPWQEFHGMTNQVTPGLVNGMYKHIAIVSPAGPTTPFLYNADVVITDYSSIMFDAYLLDKPVVLFEKTPGYTFSRGMYLDYPSQYCSYSATEECVLLDTMRYRARHPFLTETEKRCRTVVADMCDGHACERLISLINDLNK